jgi:hypothetical protein
MKSSTAYNHFRRLRSRLESLFGVAECYKPTHKSLVEDYVKVLGDPALERCPSWVRRGLNDYAQSRFHRIERELLVWLHPTPSGFKSWELLSPEERAACLAPGYSGKHVWLHETTGRGTIADRNRYEQGALIFRSFLITDRTY